MRREIRAEQLLKQLVDLKLLKEKMEAGEAQPVEAATYAANKEAAWAEAKAYFAPCGTCKRAWNVDCWYVHCERFRRQR